MNDMRGVASLLASQGRNGDSRLVHMTPEEIGWFDDLGVLTENPVTGLPEAFNFGDFIKGISRFALSAMGTAIGGPVGGAVGSAVGKKFLGGDEETQNGFQAGLESVAGAAMANKAGAGRSGPKAAASTSVPHPALSAVATPLDAAEYWRRQEQGPSIPEFDRVVSNGDSISEMTGGSGSGGKGGGGFFHDLMETLNSDAAQSFLLPMIGELLNRRDTPESEYDRLSREADEDFAARGFGPLRGMQYDTPPPRRFAAGGNIDANFRPTTYDIHGNPIQTLDQELRGWDIGGVNVDPRYKAGFMPEAQYFDDNFAGSPIIGRANRHLIPSLNRTPGQGNPFNTSGTDRLLESGAGGAFNRMNESFSGNGSVGSPSGEQSETQGDVRSSDGYNNLVENIFAKEDQAYTNAKERLPYNGPQINPWNPTPTTGPGDVITPGTAPTFDWEMPEWYGGSTTFGGARNKPPVDLPPTDGDPPPRTGPGPDGKIPIHGNGSNPVPWKPIPVPMPGTEDEEIYVGPNKDSWKFDEDSGEYVPIETATTIEELGGTGYHDRERGWGGDGPNPDIPNSSEEAFLRNLRIRGMHNKGELWDEFTETYLVGDPQQTSYYRDIIDRILEDPDGFLEDRPDFEKGYIDNFADFMASIDKNPPPPDKLSLYGQRFAQDGSNLMEWNQYLNVGHKNEYGMHVSRMPDGSLNVSFMGGPGVDTPNSRTAQSLYDVYAIADEMGYNTPSNWEDMKADRSKADAKRAEEAARAAEKSKAFKSELARVDEYSSNLYDYWLEQGASDSEAKNYALEKLAETQPDVASRLRGYASGGMVRGYAGGGLLSGPGGGMDDGIPAFIGETGEPIEVASGEFIIPADVVSMLGDGDTEAGAMRLHEMMARVRESKTGTQEQAPQINPNAVMPE